MKKVRLIKDGNIILGRGVFRNQGPGGKIKLVGSKNIRHENLVEKVSPPPSPEIFLGPSSQDFMSEDFKQ